MSKLIEFVGFVNSQAEFHERMAVRFQGDTRRFELHSSTAKKCRDLAVAIEENEKILNTPASLKEPKASALTLEYSEIEDLPDELIAELSISDSDKNDYNLISLINAAGGVASLDRLLVDLYRQSGEISKRQNLNARIYRMVQKGMLFNVPGKKGAYSTDPIENGNEGGQLELT